MKFTGKRILTLLFFCFSCQGLFPADLDEIFNQFSIFGNEESMILDIDMKISDNRSEKERSLQLWLDRSADETKILLKIIQPGFLSRMKFLTHLHSDGTDSSWLSTSQGIRRLTTSTVNQPLFDSDFTAEDIIEIRAEDYELISETEKVFSGTPVIEYELKVLNRMSRYDKKIFIMDKETMNLLGILFFDRGKKIKEFTVTEFLPGVSIPRTSVMIDLKKESSTELTVTSYDVESEIPSSVFNKAGMQ